MRLDHVFARGPVSLVLHGVPHNVAGGSCWLADDPLVVAYPAAFTYDCRYAIGRDKSWSGEVPGCMNPASPDFESPEDDELPQRGHRRPQPAVRAGR